MHAVILAGGKGQRLWPASTPKLPKHFLKFTDDKSLLQNTYSRAMNIEAVKNIVTVTNINYLAKVQQNYELFKPYKKNSRIILEPAAKDTTAAIASAALWIRKLYGPEELILVMPSDHVIVDQSSLESAIAQASIYAGRDNIVTLGIIPDSPNTNYGYIKYDREKVIKFVEKPNYFQAREYLKSGDFLWNSGIYCFTSQAIIEQLDTYCPQIMELVRKSIDQSTIGEDQNLYLDKESWQSLSSIAIDYSLMEKSDKMVVIKCEAGWKDIGTWKSVSELFPTDSNGNNLRGQALIYDSTDCYIQSSSKIVVAIGVTNLAIIETENGFLVMDKNQASSVKDTPIFSKNEVLAETG